MRQSPDAWRLTLIHRAKARVERYTSSSRPDTQSRHTEERASAAVPTGNRIVLRSLAATVRYRSVTSRRISRSTPETRSPRNLFDLGGLRWLRGPARRQPYT